MDKEDGVHIYNGILLGPKKNEIMPLAATWMDHGYWVKLIRKTKTDGI